MHGYDNKKSLQLCERTRVQDSTPLEHPEQRLKTSREHDILLEQLFGRDEVLLGGWEEDVLDRAFLRVELVLRRRCKRRGGRGSG